MKLGPKRYGPFKVLKQLSKVTYQLKLPNQWKIHNTFHANLLTPYKETEIHGINFLKPPPEMIEGQEEYEVERIIDQKIKGRNRNKYFLIKWKGYPPSNNSWEKEDVHAPELVKQFLKTKMNKQRR